MELSLGSNPLRIDTDGDAVPDADSTERDAPIDNCITVPNPNQRNTDLGLAAATPATPPGRRPFGDACDDDDDDGVPMMPAMVCGLPRRDGV